MKGHERSWGEATSTIFLKYCRPAINGVGAVLLRQFQPTASACTHFTNLSRRKESAKDTRHNAVESLNEVFGLGGERSSGKLGAEGGSDCISRRN